MISLQDKDSEEPTVEKRAIMNWAATKTPSLGEKSIQQIILWILKKL